MTTKECVKVLVKRRDWLDTRIREGEAVGRNLTFDKQERSALDFAIEVLNGHGTSGKAVASAYSDNF